MPLTPHEILNQLHAVLDELSAPPPDPDPAWRKAQADTLRALATEIEGIEHGPRPAMLRNNPHW